MTDTYIEYRVEWLSQSGWHPWGSAVRTDRARAEAECAGARKVRAYSGRQFRVVERIVTRTEWMPSVTSDEEVIA